jgi:hypothetical protein
MKVSGLAFHPQPLALNFALRSACARPVSMDAKRGATRQTDTQVTRLL